jgi:uncharacterized DUF497 family protein
MWQRAGPTSTTTVWPPNLKSIVSSVIAILVLKWYKSGPFSAGVLEFEFDPEKSRVNLEKHGIDFLQAQSLWLDENRVEIPARTEDEPRALLIAKWDGRLWSAIFTWRGHSIRIISVRRSRKQEEVIYEG